VHPECSSQSIERELFDGRQSRANLSRQFLGLRLANSVPDADFDDAVARLLDSLRAGAPASRAMVKVDVNRHLRPHDTGVFKRSIMSPEMREGMDAFLDKREPEWPR